MPGLRKIQLAQLVEVALVRSGVEILTSGFAGPNADLPWVCDLQFSFSLVRQYRIYFWTIGHGGRTRSVDEYRIQTKLKWERELRVATGTTLLLGYYNQSLDSSGRSVGIEPPEGMEVFAAWDPLLHLKLGASSSCQVQFEVMCEAHLMGKACSTRTLADGQQEIIYAYRPEYLSSYVRSAAGGHDRVRLQDLEPAIEA